MSQLSLNPRFLKDDSFDKTFLNTSDLIKGFSMLKHFIMLMVVVHILLNVFYSAFQIESITVNNTTVSRLTVTCLTLHVNLV